MGKGTECNIEDRIVTKLIGYAMIIAESCRKGMGIKRWRKEGVWTDLEKLTR